MIGAFQLTGEIALDGPSIELCREPLTNLASLVAARNCNLVSSTGSGKSDTPHSPTTPTEPIHRELQSRFGADIDRGGGLLDEKSRRRARSNPVEAREAAEDSNLPPTHEAAAVAGRRPRDEGSPAQGRRRRQERERQHAPTPATAARRVRIRIRRSVGPADDVVEPALGRGGEPRPRAGRRRKAVPVLVRLHGRLAELPVEVVEGGRQPLGGEQPRPRRGLRGLGERQRPVLVAPGRVGVTEVGPPESQPVRPARRQVQLEASP